MPAFSAAAKAWEGLHHPWSVTAMALCPHLAAWRIKAVGKRGVLGTHLVQVQFHPFGLGGVDAHRGGGLHRRSP